MYYCLRRAIILSLKDSSPERKFFYPATYYSINRSLTLTPARASYDDWYIVRRFRHLQTVNLKDRYRSGQTGGQLP